MILVGIQLAWAVNYWRYRPTFLPYGIAPKLVGIMFCILAVGHLVIFHRIRTVRAIRWMLWTSFVMTLFWGLSNTQQFRQGRASLALPISLIGIAAVHVPLAFMTVALAVRKR